MNTQEAIETRRSVKQFDPDAVMPIEDERRLMELAVLSPTAFNIQHWRVVAVKDPALRRQMRTIAWDQSQVTDASLFLVLCADLKAWKKQPERYWANADETTRNIIVGSIGTYYEGREWIERDAAVGSVAMMAQTLMLAARELGYDSCPMAGFNYDAMGQLINLPEDHIVVMALAIGKPLVQARPRGGQLPLEEIVVADRF